MYADKFDGYYDELIGEWEEKMMEFKAEQETEQLFRDAQGLVDKIANILFKFGATIRKPKSSVKFSYTIFLSSRRTSM